MVDAHDQTVTNHYVLHYPSHQPRSDDPHYAAFNAFHDKYRRTARCDRGRKLQFGDCADAQGHPLTVDVNGQQSGMELHHRIVEFATANLVDLKAIGYDFPNITTQEQLDIWVESEINFVWLCAKCHRGTGGVHHAAAADWAAEEYIRGLITK